MKSVRVICSVAVLALTVSAHGQSTNSNFTLARKDFPATKTSSDVPVKVMESVSAPMLIEIATPPPVASDFSKVQTRFASAAPRLHPSPWELGTLGTVGTALSQ